MVAMHWGFMFVPFIGLVVLGGFVALIVLVVRAATMSPQTYPQPPVAPPAPRETPLDILARRFASGEITAEEYTKARDLLQGGKSS